MLNLNSENTQVEEEKGISLTDLLQLELDFQEAYQAFVDYKNICEIVVNAKASVESMKFANSLLNASTENIKVSVEELSGKFMTAWNKFTGLWKSFSTWAGDNIAKLTPTKLPAEVSPSTRGLRAISSNLQYEKSVPDNKNRKDNKSVISAYVLTEVRKAIQTKESLENADDIKLWKRYAKEAVKALNEHIDFCNKNISSIKQNTENTAYYTAAKYYMMIGPKIVAEIRKTFMKLSGTVIDTKSTFPPAMSTTLVPA